MPVIRDIVIEGGVTLTEDTVSYYLGLMPDDPLDHELISEGYRRLWDSGLFEDVRLEVELHDDGSVTLFVVVVERPFVTSVDFEGNKKIKSADLKDKLDERGVDVPRNVPLKMAQLGRIESAIKEVYDSEGFRSAIVNYQSRKSRRTRSGSSTPSTRAARSRSGRFSSPATRLLGFQAPRGAQKDQEEESRHMFGDNTVYTKETMGRGSRQPANVLWQPGLHRCLNRRADDRAGGEEPGRRNAEEEEVQDEHHDPGRRGTALHRSATSRSPARSSSTPSTLRAAVRR